MTRAEAAVVYQRMVAIWPDVADVHDDATVRVWLDMLVAYDSKTAHRAVDRLQRSARRFPPMADFVDAAHAVLHDDRLHATPPRELDEPRSAAGREFLQQISETLRAAAKAPTNQQLDAAGVFRWRERLADAAHRDAVEGTHRRHFDLARAAIRDEYEQIVGKAKAR